MKHGVNRTLYQYWDELRGTRTAPNRSEIDPGRIRGLLGDTFILEAVDQDTYRYRLAGTRLCSTHCRELKGRNFLRGWGNEDREALASVMAAITEDAAAAVIGVDGHTERNQVLKMEMLLLPLHMPGEGRSRILGASASFERPYWLGLHPILNQSISSLRLIWPDERPSFLTGTPAPRRTAVPQIINGGQAHLAAPSMEGTRRVGHLTVYDGGKI
ncbi:PAS domain-containing protein [Pannonibacter sp. Q-1]|jgi:hypothetical protein|uniref:Uncharacterized protein n=1 Tax=Pannonibacter phragmitetus TaxID=121719 RepID=A0A0L0J167_9HYPH|nr:MULTISPECIES: PAS domain-containing protein [Pannonibacter]ALV28439.1 hypothetical protein APZ00_16335 [Pannonibacter phragmitetus]KND19362.1 hypothetical protein ADZ37_10205 [Pannonibacter phragmitetus]MBA4204375.1 PAS domain-containing protein [Polymorphum sp.]